jgi:transmembrane sensor
MTPVGKSREEEVPLVRSQAEAAAWIALLHSSERSASVEAGLRQWIASDPLHATAWEVATDIWNDTAGLPRRIPLSRVIWNRSRRAFLKPVLAVAALCLVFAGVALHHYLQPSVNTTVGEQRTLNLEDGTRIELNTDSYLLVKYDKRTRTVVLKSGEAYFQVAHENRPFIVIAGERKIMALGTAFTVRRDQTADESLTVTLIEGRVAVVPVDAPSISAATPAVDMKLLNPGQRLRMRRHDPPAVDSPSMDKATGWMRGQLIFDHTPLREAIAEFNRYSDLKITVASALVGEIPVGGIFRISDSKSFARAVAETYNLRLTLQDSELVLNTAAGTASLPTPPEAPKP